MWRVYLSAEGFSIILFVLSMSIFCLFIVLYIIMMSNKMMVSKEGLDFLNEEVKYLEHIEKVKEITKEKRRNALKVEIDRTGGEEGTKSRGFRKPLSTNPRHNTIFASAILESPTLSMRMNSNNSKQDSVGLNTPLDGNRTTKRSKFQPISGFSNYLPSSISIRKTVADAFNTQKHAPVHVKIDHLAVLKESLKDSKFDRDSYLGRKTSRYLHMIKRQEQQDRIMNMIDIISKKKNVTEGDLITQSSLANLIHGGSQVNDNYFKELQEVHKLNKLKHKFEIDEKVFIKRKEDLHSAFEVNLSKKAAPKKIFDQVTLLNDQFHDTAECSTRTMGIKLPCIQVSHALKMMHKDNKVDTNNRPIRHTCKHKDTQDKARTMPDDRNLESAFSFNFIKTERDAIENQSPSKKGYTDKSSTKQLPDLALLDSPTPRYLSPTKEKRKEFGITPQNQSPQNISKEIEQDFAKQAETANRLIIFNIPHK